VVYLAQQQALPFLGGAPFGDVEVDPVNKRRAAVGVALDNLSARRQPAGGCDTGDAVFARNNRRFPSTPA
jgi:hypothetical protein